MQGTPLHNVPVLAWTVIHVHRTYNKVLTTLKHHDTVMRLADNVSFPHSTDWDSCPGRRLDEVGRSLLGTEVWGVLGELPQAGWGLLKWKL